MEKKYGISCIDIIKSAITSCKNFVNFSDNFFSDRDPWLGWENWLTVDIARQLNNRNVIPFAPYSECGLSIKAKMDLLVKGPQLIAIEIKTSYLTDAEIETYTDKKKDLPDRAINDIKKLKKAGAKCRKILLFSTVFNSKEGLEKYRNRKFNKNQRVLNDMNWKWYDCSVRRMGHNLLLVVSDILRLPNVNALT